MRDDRVWRHFSVHHGVISREEAVELELTTRQIRHRVSSGEWVELQPTVYRHAAAPTTWEAKARAAALSAGGLVSHRASARCWGLDGFSSSVIEVVVADGTYRNNRSFLTHRSVHMHLAGSTHRHGIPVTGIDRTILDLAASVGPRRLRKAIDAGLRQRLVTWQSLYSTLVRHSARGRDGCGKLRLELEQRYGDSAIPDSNWNRDVGYLLTDGGLPEPEFEYEVHHRGAFVARVDLAYPEAKLAIECDSVRWHANSESFVSDPRRRNKLLNAGWRVLSFTWADYANQPAQLVTTVWAALHPRSVR